jgi:hypothetical protein
MLPRCIPSGSSCARDGSPQRRPAKRGFSAADSPVPAGDARPPRPVPDPPGLHRCPRDGGALSSQTEKGRLRRSEAKASRQSRDRLKRHPQEGQHSAASWRDPGPSASGERHSIARGIEADRRAPLWREEEGSVRKNGAYWFGSYLPDLPVSETTETSKEERDQSMSGNVSKLGAAARWRAQGKVCKVKAVLPESQFPVAKGLAVANAADTLRRAGQIAPASAICTSPRGTTSVGGSRKRRDT